MIPNIMRIGGDQMKKEYVKPELGTIEQAKFEDVYTTYGYRGNFTPSYNSCYHKWESGCGPKSC